MRMIYECIQPMMNIKVSNTLLVLLLWIDDWINVEKCVVWLNRIERQVKMRHLPLMALYNHSAVLQIGWASKC